MGGKKKIFTSFFHISKKVFTSSKMTGYICCLYLFYAIFLVSVKERRVNIEEDSDMAFAGSLSDVIFNLLINSCLNSS